MRPPSILLASILLAAMPATASTCFGTSSNGRIEHAVALRERGPNFAPYSALGVTLARTYVHETVQDIVEGAYATLERELPGVSFVYGETGLKNGGPMPPHRIHENGTAVDFMVPVRGRQGRPAALPASALNRFGYDLEFDKDGRLDDLRIDFAAIAAHLHQLDQQARKRGVRIARVIFDPALTRHLLAAPHGASLAALPFMKTRPWVRHDEHYHVDFAIGCQTFK